MSAVVGALVTSLVVGVPTDVIPNPVFGRPVDADATLANLRGVQRMAVRA